MARKTLDPNDITIIVDTREQTPWDMTPLKTEVGTLDTGDYTVKGLEKEISIERKSLDDLLGCVGQSRERFDREIKRMLGYPCRAVIVEAHWQEIMLGNWRARVTPNAVMGSVLGWIAHGVPVIFAGNASEAALYAGRLMFIAARRRFEELQSFYSDLKVV